MRATVKVTGFDVDLAAALRNIKMDYCRQLRFSVGVCAEGSLYCLYAASGIEQFADLGLAQNQDLTGHDVRLPSRQLLAFLVGALIAHFFLNIADH